ncbi:MAG: hypothetical protein AAB638_02505 [Patescibacteria group bacterium]
MSQTINLRKKEAEIKPEPKVEAEVEIPESKREAEPVASGISWMTYLSRPPRKNVALTIASMLAAAGCLVAYFNHDFLFMIVLFLAALIIILNTFRIHRPHHIRVHATGISVGDENHHFADMKSFWINYEPHVKEVSIHLKKAYMPMIKIPLEDTNPLEIRQAMISYVPEKEHEQSLLDDIVRLIGM